MPAARHRLHHSANMSSNARNRHPHHLLPHLPPALPRRLSKRQRKLYEEYMASGSTRATLASGNFLGIMNCLMQLRKASRLARAHIGELQPSPARKPRLRAPALAMRRVLPRMRPGRRHSPPVVSWRLPPCVLPANFPGASLAPSSAPLPLPHDSHSAHCAQVCNHPDLFEGRPIVSAFDMQASGEQGSERAVDARGDVLRMAGDVPLEAWPRPALKPYFPWQCAAPPPPQPPHTPPTHPPPHQKHKPKRKRTNTPPALAAAGAAPAQCGALAAGAARPV